MAHGDSISYLKAKITVLERARRRIETNKDPYICWALTAVATKAAKAIHSDAAYALISYIGARLGVYSTLDTWLYYKGKTDGWLTPAQMRVHRIQWINWMLNDLRTQIRERTS